jgi:hypothetical protein
LDLWFVLISVLIRTCVAAVLNDAPSSGTERVTREAR